MQTRLRKQKGSPGPEGRTPWATIAPARPSVACGPLASLSPATPTPATSRPPAPSTAGSRAAPLLRAAPRSLTPSPSSSLLRLPLNNPGARTIWVLGWGGQLRPYMVWKGASDSFDDLYSQPQTCQPVSPKRLPSALWGAFGSLSSKAPVPWPWGHCAFWFSSRPHHASRRLPAGLPGSQVCPLPFVPASTATSPP